MNQGNKIWIITRVTMDNNIRNQKTLENSNRNRKREHTIKQVTRSTKHTIHEESNTMEVTIQEESNDKVNESYI